MPCEKLLVFLKAARRGSVKTRLAAELGDDAALSAYQDLVATTLAKLSSLAAVELRFAPDEAAAEIRPWLRPGWNAAPQGGGGLGNRLARAFAEAFAAGSERVIVIGSDCPYLNAADIRAAGNALAESDVVIGPATDGGYWLLGMRTYRPELFSDIAWSTSQVLAQTLRHAAASRLSVTLLRELGDVDTVADWRSWQKVISEP